MKVCVVTIDPAQRLADALGLDALGNAPHRVDAAPFAAAGLPFADGGELWALQLDAKRTFDELIERLAPDERTREEILANRIYRELSGAVAGSQEFTAIAKLHDLAATGRVRPARARHAAVAQRARLPRRARPPDAVLRGPRAAGAAAAERASG